MVSNAGNAERGTQARQRSPSHAAYGARATHTHHVPCARRRGHGGPRSGGTARAAGRTRAEHAPEGIALLSRHFELLLELLDILALLVAEELRRQPVTGSAAQLSVASAWVAHTRTLGGSALGGGCGRRLSRLHPHPRRRLRASSRRRRRLGRRRSGCRAPRHRYGCAEWGGGAAYCVPSGSWLWHACIRCDDVGVQNPRLGEHGDAPAHQHASER